ncbi:hypothetical protein SEPCBS119000_003899 [Sporothrix epigloea]|uniref:Uncharacterized protein n=1 Tax=Sporothrix epigloea TaxID=1892477 RepID=A0ABP0DPF6_9PEZI
MAPPDQQQLPPRGVLSLQSRNKDGQAAVPVTAIDPKTIPRRHPNNPAAVLTHAWRPAVSPVSTHQLNAHVAASAVVPLALVRFFLLAIVVAPSAALLATEM